MSRRKRKKSKSFKLFVVVLIILILLFIVIKIRVNEMEVSKQSNNTKLMDYTNAFNNIKTIQEYSKDTTVNQMNVFFFGSYFQNSNNSKNKVPIEWIVIDNDKESKKVLLLSKYIIDCKCYNNSEDVVTWKTSGLRKWLNKYFYNNAFSKEEKKRILTTKVINTGNKDFGADGGKDTYDKVFCLSADEVKNYFNPDDIYNTNYRIATKGTEYAKSVKNRDGKLYVINSDEWYGGNSCFWLRTPGFQEDYVEYVHFSGYIDDRGQGADYREFGVRPAIWISY